MSAPVFVADAATLAEAVAGARIRLTGPEGHHAATVRRLRPGEPVVVTDGTGRAAACRVAAVMGRDVVELDVDTVRDEPAPAPRLVVVQALAKGEHGELAVDLMTQVGVDVIVPWAASRSVVQWRGDKLAKGRARWRATAHEAAKQARRARFPEVTEPASTAEVVALLQIAACALVLHESAEQPLAGLALPDAGDVVVVVGPEGGIAPDELDAFVGAGAVVVRLGETVLRTSSAGAAALAVASAATRWR
ncbi:MAG TPA: 16S rRNA (uracil(1498)-N(3))-methyltransferase [Actinomycetes bacterium]|nr:16S rRNA (uracil(1498)-N(3))-methyltransferase [Actinomycetes bacterium]